MFVLELARFDRAVARHVPTLLVASFAAFGIARATGIGDVIPASQCPRSLGRSSPNAFSWGLPAERREPCSARGCALRGASCAIG